MLLLLAVVIIPSAQAQYKSLELSESSNEIIKPIQLKLNDKIKPPAEELIGEFFLGNAGGLALGFGLGYVGYAIDKGGGSRGHGAGLGGAIIGFVAGHCAGSIIGVYTVGSSKNLTGNLESTILGGIAGTGTGIGFLYLTQSPLAYAGFAFPTIGAMVGFNGTLQYKDAKDINKESELKNLGSQLKIKNDIEVNVVSINFEIPKSLAQSLQF